MKIIKTYDNNYLLACDVSNTKDDLLLLKMSDQYGNIKWSKYYGENFRIIPIGEIYKTQDHGFIITGRAKERNTNEDWKTYINVV